MNHTFDVKLAIDFCPNTAIFLNNLAHWTQFNHASSQNFHDGRYWTYNSARAFAIIFPYWSEKQIRTIVKSCLENGLIISGNYNKAGYDKTSWYALTDKALTYYADLKESLETPAQPHVTKRSHRSAQTVTPIPDINTDIKQDLNTAQSAQKDLKPVQPSKTLTVESIQENNPYNLPMDLIQEWISHRKSKRLPVTPRVLKSWNKELAKCAKPMEAFEFAVNAGWQGFKADWINKDNPKTPIYDDTSTAWAEGIEDDLF